jgi:hypothetical protein
VIAQLVLILAHGQFLSQAFAEVYFGFH